MFYLLNLLSYGKIIVKFGDIMKKVELLAPAGNMMSLKAAIMAGCDAVYLGGKIFGARAFSKNFTNDEIIEAHKVSSDACYFLKLETDSNHVLNKILDEINEFANYQLSLSVNKIK